MIRVFLASWSGDRPRASRIVRGLRESGLSVSWDADLLGKPGWRREVERQVEAARCVVVVWSRAFDQGGAGGEGDSGEVALDLAARGKARGVLVAVRIDQVEPPLGFGDVPVVDLTGWRGRVRNRRFQHLQARIRAVAAGGVPPELPATVRRKRLATRLAGAAGFAMVLIGFLSDALGIQDLGCRVPGVHQVCGALGLGGVPTTAELASWKAREPGDCGALRSHLEAFPKGAFAEEATWRLSAPRTVVDDLWVPEEHRLPLYVASGEEPSPEEQAARAAALERGRRLAEDACVGFSSGPFRLLSASAEPSEWKCRPRAGGTLCAFDGQAVCRVEALRRTEREVCGP